MRAAHVGVQLGFCVVSLRKLKSAARGTRRHTIFQSKVGSSCRELLVITAHLKEIVSDKQLLCSFQDEYRVGQ